MINEAIKAEMSIEHALMGHSLFSSHSFYHSRIQLRCHLAKVPKFKYFSNPDALIDMTP
jgi:hypothetical protein